jgi:hypothetical protein
MGNPLKFRIQTVGYYEVDPAKLEEQYDTDDPIEAALIEQDHFRELDDPLITVNQRLDSKAEVFINVFDPGGMMFTDEFMREVIQILRITKFYVDINHHFDPDLRVAVILEGDNLDGDTYHFTAQGQAIGQALRKIREQIRTELGK